MTLRPHLAMGLPFRDTGYYILPAGKVKRTVTFLYITSYLLYFNRDDRKVAMLQIHYLWGGNFFNYWQMTKG
jgi:hypothetical protein